MRDRAIGIENEYAVVVAEKKDDGQVVFWPPAIHRPVFASPEFLTDFTAHIPPQPTNTNLYTGAPVYQPSIYAWLRNGGLVYMESAGEGTHPEYASPESRRIIDVVRYNKAGEKLICLAFPNCKVFKNNSAPGSGSPVDSELRTMVATYGCHENYLIFGIKDFEDPPFVSSLAPFLATRHIIDGAGCVHCDTGQFYLSQRSRFIETTAHASTTGSRGIINLRPEDHVGSNSHIRRLHLILGDANMMETAIFLKVGATSLVLSMIEDNCAPSFGYQGSWFWPDCLRAINQDLSGKEKLIIFSNGEKFSALEMQWVYCKAAERYLRQTNFESEASEAEAKKTLLIWQKALDALYANDLEWLVGRLDHPTLRYIIDGMAERGFVSIEEKRRIDQNYRKINEGENLSKRISDRLSHTRLLADKDITDAMISPPVDTRAKLRGDFVARLIDKNIRDKGASYSISWTSLRFGDVIEEIADPLCYSGERFKRVFDAIDS